MRIEHIIIDSIKYNWLVIVNVQIRLHFNDQICLRTVNLDLINLNLNNYNIIRCFKTFTS